MFFHSATCVLFPSQALEVSSNHYSPPPPKPFPQPSTFSRPRSLLAPASSSVIMRSPATSLVGSCRIGKPRRRHAFYAHFLTDEVVKSFLAHMSLPSCLLCLAGAATSSFGHPSKGQRIPITRMESLLVCGTTWEPLLNEPTLPTFTLKSNFRPSTPLALPWTRLRPSTRTAPAAWSET